MRSRGPVMTLLAGLVLAGVLAVLSMNATRSADQAAEPVNAPAGSAAPDGDSPADAAPAEPDDPLPDPPSGDDDGGDRTGDDRTGDDRTGDGAPAVPAANQNVTWAGTVDGGSGTTVAITAKGGRAVAYVCDGTRIEAWLQGTAADGRLRLTASDKAIKASLTGTFTAARASGRVTVEGSTFTFDIGTARKPSGLYRASADVRGARLVGGWIVLADGTQVGLATFAGSTVPVAPLDLDTRTVAVYGTRVTARPVVPGGAR